MAPRKSKRKRPGGTNPREAVGLAASLEQLSSVSQSIIELRDAHDGSVELMALSNEMQSLHMGLLTMETALHDTSNARRVTAIARKNVDAISQLVFELTAQVRIVLDGFVGVHQTARHNRLPTFDTHGQALNSLISQTRRVRLEVEKLAQDFQPSSRSVL